ncbi:MAG: cation diffusion facilitator family transporter [Coriobacteriia bacterium]|nr:cation diffusion facilitator family transporter [Coriobacteriia bacterium]
MGYTRPSDSEAGTLRVKRIRTVLWAVLALNVGVALAKIGWGTVSGSAAMQADGFHSLFDGASNVIGLVGMAIAGRPADRDHPYGHDKFESYASAAIAGMLAFAAYRIGSSALSQLSGAVSPPQVDAVSFAVMIATLAVNIGVSTWERRVGRELGSEILIADASHTRSDIFVSLGVILSLVMVKAGFPQADPVVALLVSAMIVYTAVAVFRQASATLSDSARISTDEICACVLAVAGVLGCHHIRTRGSESAVYVDLHVQVDETRSVADGHEIAENVERAIGAAFPQVVDVIAHLEPYDEYQATKTEREQTSARG